jgi:hypothetical protein
MTKPGCHPHNKLPYFGITRESMTHPIAESIMEAALLPESSLNLVSIWN